MAVQWGLDFAGWNVLEGCPQMGVLGVNDNHAI
jgi:hypothetical protein